MNMGFKRLIYRGFCIRKSDRNQRFKRSLTYGNNKKGDVGNVVNLLIMSIDGEMTTSGAYSD